jgi:hypothetical protein
VADDDLRLPSDPDLERLRQILYGDLPVEEGRERLVGVFALRAQRRELIDDLFRRVQRIVDEQD